MIEYRIDIRNDQQLGLLADMRNTIYAIKMINNIFNILQEDHVDEHNFLMVDLVGVKENLKEIQTQIFMSLGINIPDSDACFSIVPYDFEENRVLSDDEFFELFDTRNMGEDTNLN